MTKIENLECILLIDDDGAVNFINELIIKKAGIKTHIQIAINAQQGLDYLMRAGDFLEFSNSIQPGIIFLDINMPGMNGWDFLSEYKKLPKQQRDQTVVVMLTSSINPDDKQKGENHPEVVAFMNKPLSKDSIMEIIKSHFSKFSIE
tara:strand:+ start:667 stop:1107 length:441 start_codon:yes stop_codon:yes gene_type:complete